MQSPLNSRLVLSSYVFDMHSTRFRNAIYLATTLVCVLGKRRRDEEDENDFEPPCKRQCIRPPFWSFDEFWVDSESDDKSEDEWVVDEDIPKISLELEDSSDDEFGPISSVR